MGPAAQEAIPLIEWIVEQFDQQSVVGDFARDARRSIGDATTDSNSATGSTKDPSTRAE
jgi:hypothetical protein